MAFSKAKALQEAEKSVSQGKIAQAIKQYLEILENDPSDLTLLNTVGDLYIRDRNITEGLRQFHRLAEAYVREGFNVKAIAIYRKITKIDSNNVETLLKLAELYQLQGLGRETREQYLQAADFFKKRNQADRSLDVLRKLLQLDPENAMLRQRLAGECAQAGKSDEAAKVYLEFAETSLRRNNLAAAEPALKKAAELDPKNSKVRLLWARAALSQQQPEEAEKILNASPELAANPEGKQILLECHFARGQQSQAQQLVMEIYRANPSDFTPLANFVTLSLDKAGVEVAFQPLAQVAEELIEQGNTGPLMEALRKLWNKAPSHLPTLELIYHICDRTADEFSLPEILEALGHAYVQTGDLEKAETAYSKLTNREPENQHYRGLLRQVQQKLNKTSSPASALETAITDSALAAEGESAGQTPPADAEQQEMVREAIENSDLFARYHLVDKAVAELDKVLQIYPNQVEILKRIVEITRQALPLRAASAAADLVSIFTAQGDQAGVNKYRPLVSAMGPAPGVAPPSPAQAAEEPATLPPPPAPAAVSAAETEAPPAPSPPPSVPSDQVPALAEAAPAPEGDQAPQVAPPPPPPAAMEIDLNRPAPSPDLAFDLTSTASAQSEAAAPPEVEVEFDLSSDLEAMTGPSLDVGEPPAKVEAQPAVPEVEAPLPEVPPAEAEAPSIPAREPPAVPTEVLALEAVEEPVTPNGAPMPEASRPPFASEEVPAAPPPGEAPKVEEVPAASLPETPLESPEAPPAQAEQAPATSEEAVPAPPPEPESAEPPEPETTTPVPAEVPAPAPPEPPAPDLEVPSDLPEVSVVSETEAATFNFEESKLEVEFYLEHGFLEEARQAVAALEEKYPGNDLVADLRLRVEESKDQAPAAQEEVEVSKATPEDQGEKPAQDWELPTTYASTSSPPPSPAEMASIPVGELSRNNSSGGGGSTAEILGDLTANLASPLEHVLNPPGPSEATLRPPAPPPGAAELSGLLDELEEPGFGQIPTEDDPETHYNLGVAFREMGLLEEAIGEFQKVVRGAGKGLYPPNFLQACSLLAICFMDKKMPSVAIKWYLRALEAPGLEEEAVLALQYDLGVAYEQVGDAQSALGRFTEVYSQNIDFRDVAEKIRVLQQKA